MKKIISAAVAVLLLAAMTVANASMAGTAADSLITKSTLDADFVPGLLEDMREKMENRLRSVYDMAAAPYGGQGANLSYTSGQTRLDLSAGGSVTVSFGASVIPLSGNITLTVSAGEVIDIASGAVVSSGAALSVGHRYFAAEDALAVCSAPSGASLMLDGPYIPGAGVESPAYSDVSPDQWFAGAASYAREKEIFRDWSAGLFRPYDSMTRVEIVYAIWKAAGSPATDYRAPFTDVTDPWYTPAVNWAAQTGIVLGITPTLLDPDTRLDRCAAVTMLYRAAAYTGGDTAARADLTVFSDHARVPDWGFEPMGWAVARKIVQGMDNNIICPQGEVNRAQTAAMIQRMFG